MKAPPTYQRATHETPHQNALNAHGNRMLRSSCVQCHRGALELWRPAMGEITTNGFVRTTPARAEA
jgi:hypothetical protein